MPRWFPLVRRPDRRSRRLRFEPASTLAAHVDVLENRVMLSAANSLDNEHVGEIRDKVGQTLETVKNGVSQLLQGNLDISHDDSDTEDSQLETALSDLGNKLEEKLGSVFDRVQEKLNSALDRVQQKLDNAFSKVDEHLGHHSEDEEDNQTHSSSSLPELPDALDDLADEDADELKSTLLGDAEETDQLKDLLHDLSVKGVLGSDIAPLEKLYDAADQLDADGKQDSADKLREFADRIVNVKTEIASRAAALAQQFDGVEADQIAGHIRERVQDKLEDTFGHHGDGALGFASNLIQSIFSDLDLDDLP